MLSSLLTKATDNAALGLPFLLYLLFRFAYFLVEVPTVRMVEHATCHQQLDGRELGLVSLLTDFDEERCKTVPVQQQVSSIIGWKMCFDAVPGLLSILYFGSLADKYGHRLVLTLCCVGFLLALLWLLMTCYFHSIFPLSLVWLSSVFLLIGGGPLVFAAVTAALVANLADASSRTRYLFVLSATPHFGKLISPPIARALMKANIYIPSLVSSSIILLCILLLRFIRNPIEATVPERSVANQSTEPLLAQPEPAYGATDSSDPSASQRPLATEENSTISNSRVANGGNETWKLQSLAHLILRRLKSDTFSLHRDLVLNICHVAFFLKSNAMASEAFVFQYLSERFDWQLRDTTILRFALSFGAVITTLILGPLATLIFTARGVPAPAINLTIIRLSTLVLVVCFIAAWRVSSSTAFILSMLGAGFCEGLEPALLSFISGRVSNESRARVFALAFMCSLLGDMTGGPLMSMLMSIGRSRDGISSGYCFLTSAVMLPSAPNLVSRLTCR
ncbi:hypothetical protein LCI18_004402 [Fusarium solani-melongenae]|uniref:Uncharacterized protein n=1 Tax=Fusarium solani subsp. cucurbitae TaxID=2747967 RepID=A0ACD3YWX4_FUSSC|nr:hypothetical protein LCI18_004402 [Fusarium solani-melongenae]